MKIGNWWSRLVPLTEQLYQIVERYVPLSRNINIHTIGEYSANIMQTADNTLHLDKGKWRNGMAFTPFSTKEVTVGRIHTHPVNTIIPSGQDIRAEIGMGNQFFIIGGRVGDRPLVTVFEFKHQGRFILDSLQSIFGVPMEAINPFHVIQKKKPSALKHFQKVQANIGTTLTASELWFHLRECLEDPAIKEVFETHYGKQATINAVVDGTKPPKFNLKELQIELEQKNIDCFKCVQRNVQEIEIFRTQDEPACYEISKDFFGQFFHIYELDPPNSASINLDKNPSVPNLENDFSSEFLDP